ncbi:hypothetical protein [Crossiella sp. NPDC003009]
MTGQTWRVPGRAVAVSHPPVPDSGAYSVEQYRALLAGTPTSR